MNAIAVTETDSGRPDKSMSDAFAYWEQRVAEAEAMPDDGLPEWQTNSKSYKLRESKHRLAALEADFEIRRTVRHISNKFIYLGRLLKKVKDDGLCIYITQPDSAVERLYGYYGTFEEYVRKEFGFSRSTAYSLIGVYESFGTNDGHIRPEYESYSYSALVEMLPLSGDTLQKVTPEMTVKEIRELKASEDAATELKLTAIDKVISMSTAAQTSEAESPVIIDVESEVVQTSGQTALQLKNKSDREQWLKDYKQHCRLWVEVPPLGLKVYRYDFRNGVYMAVTEYGRGGRTYQLIADTVKVCDSFCIGSYYSPGSGLLTTAVIDFLTRSREEL